ncbi:hypothetical protein KUG88_25000 [Rhodococcus rhodochrous]|uniref:hypothetical protein n=1 Tax=Rhodococcus rhodochrous TaxID=1829 RepID=UPI001E35602A|nr:hypothetical protein [Rhodococcus rhodochrous]MCB8913380.1 hypothetical protein [Rhodococcus rhodochrous]
MRTSTERRLVVVPLVTGLGALFLVGPSTAQASPTPVSITVEAGSLSISAPTVMVDLGTMSTADHTVISGSLGSVDVVDERNAATDGQWVASVVATDFTNSSGGVIPAAAIDYRVGQISHSGSGTFTALDPSGLSTTRPVVRGTDLAGPNSASWSPTITVSVPSESMAGTYTASITHSVS